MSSKRASKSEPLFKKKPKTDTEKNQTPPASPIVNTNNTGSKASNDIIQQNQRIESMLLDIKSKVDNIQENNEKQNNLLEQQTKKMENEFTNRISNIETKLVENENNLPRKFYQEKAFINEAAQFGIDLNLDLKYNDKKILNSVDFKESNVNFYGRKLMDILYTPEEMANSTFEKTGTKCTKAELSPTRRNLIKACYFVKLKGEQEYSRCWPSILTSLNQKCSDIKSKLNGKKLNKKCQNHESESSSSGSDESDEDGNNKKGKLGKRKTVIETESEDGDSVKSDEKNESGKQVRNKKNNNKNEDESDKEKLKDKNVKGKKMNKTKSKNDADEDDEDRMRKKDKKVNKGVKKTDDEDEDEDEDDEDDNLNKSFGSVKLR